jgi:hypothetical protein
MMRPSHLASQGAGLLGRGLRETAESLAAGLELLGLGLYWLWLHLFLGALLLTKLVLTVLGPRGRSSHPKGSGR